MTARARAAWWSGRQPTRWSVTFRVVARRPAGGAAATRGERAIQRAAGLPPACTAPRCLAGPGAAVLRRQTVGEACGRRSDARRTPAGALWPRETWHEGGRRAGMGEGRRLGMPIGRPAAGLSADDAPVQATHRYSCRWSAPTRSAPRRPRARLGCTAPLPAEHQAQSRRCGPQVESRKCGAAAAEPQEQSRTRRASIRPRPARRRRRPNLPLSARPTCLLLAVVGRPALLHPLARRAETDAAQGISVRIPRAAAAALAGPAGSSPRRSARRSPSARPPPCRRRPSSPSLARSTSTC